MFGTAILLPSCGLGCSQAPTQGDHVARRRRALCGNIAVAAGEVTRHVLGWLLSTLTSHAAFPFPTGVSPVPNGAVWYLPHSAVKGTFEVVEPPGIEPDRRGLNPHQRYQAQPQLFGGPYGSRSRTAWVLTPCRPPWRPRIWWSRRKSNPPSGVSIPSRVTRRGPSRSTGLGDESIAWWMAFPP